MVFNMPLRFDRVKLMADFSKGLAKALKPIGEKAKQAMIYELSSHSGAGSSSTGASDWNRQVGVAIDFIAVNTANQVMVKVGLVNSQKDEDLMFKAMLINYGMGSDADLSGNPWLAEYLSSEYYNSGRDDFKVYSRPGEMVYNPDTNSWNESTAQIRYEIKGFHQMPTHFFENGLRMIISDFESAIDGYIREFSFDKYLAWKGR